MPGLRADMGQGPVLVFIASAIDHAGYAVYLSS